MNPISERAVHAPEVQKLTDWVRLVRYSIGHDYRPALERALVLVRGFGGRAGQQLADYLQRALQDAANQESGAASPAAFPDVPFREGQRAALDLLSFVPLIAGLDQAPARFRGAPLPVLLEAINWGTIVAVLATKIGDLPIEARCCRALGRGFEFLGSLTVGPIMLGQAPSQTRLVPVEQARRHYLRAREIYEQLVAQRPEIYRPALFFALARLSLFQYQHANGVRPRNDLTWLAYTAFADPLASLSD